VQLRDLVAGKRTVVLTGAGCSTESGIPDYRGPTGAMRARQPMTYQEFVRSADGRKRYWARSSVGWLRFAKAAPNIGHAALATLERNGHVSGVITQNVDGLHSQAGSSRLVELHGSLHRVRCLHCRRLYDRESVQEQIRADNPGYLPSELPKLAPDGDVELTAEAIERFVAPTCRDCGGALKPDVVFFGENVPDHITRDAWSMLDAGDVLMVAGSSLAVFSGYRFVRAAAERNMPVVIVNRGVTRGDKHANLRVDASVGVTLTTLVNQLSSP
jgi:NAD-dependent deacetylase sirtuin 4